MYINHLHVSIQTSVNEMFAQNNNSLPNTKRNSGDFVDVLLEIAWLSCKCFRSLLQNELAGQCIWNIQGARLVGDNNRAGSASRMSAQSRPPRAGAERTPSGPKFLKSRLKADPRQTLGPLSGPLWSKVGFGRYYIYRNGNCSLHTRS